MWDGNAMRAMERMKVGFLLTIGGFAVMTAPAFAQSTPLPNVPSFCSASTAFGQTMGSTTVIGASRAPLGVSAFVNLPVQFAPFDQAEVVVSNYGRQINRVNASMKMVDAQTAQRTAEAIRAQFRGAGWVEAGGPGLPKEAFNPLGDDIADFNSDTGGLSKSPTGRRVEISTDGKTVDVTCIDLPGFVKHMNEAFGPPPVGDKKPQPPQIVVQEAPVKFDCTKTLSESELALGANDDQVMSWMAQYKVVNDYFEQLMEWDGQQFVRAGKWTDKQKKDFEFGLLSRPELKDNWAYFLNVAAKTLTNLTAMMDAANGKDDPRACRAFNVMIDDIAEHGRRTLAHAAAIDAIYKAEAAKLGIKLD